MNYYNYIWELNDAQIATDLPQKEIVRLLQNSGILPYFMFCDNCSAIMNMVESATHKDGFMWHCTGYDKGTCRRPWKAIRHNTVMDNTRLPMRKVIRCFQRFCESRGSSFVIHDTAISHSTVVKLHKCFQRICLMIMDYERDKFNGATIEPSTAEKIRKAIEVRKDVSKEEAHLMHRAERAAIKAFKDELPQKFWLMVATILPQDQFVPAAPVPPEY